MLLSTGVISNYRIIDAATTPSMGGLFWMTAYPALMLVALSGVNYFASSAPPPLGASHAFRCTIRPRLSLSAPSSDSILPLRSDHVRNCGTRDNRFRLSRRRVGESTVRSLLLDVLHQAIRSR